MALMKPMDLKRIGAAFFCIILSNGTLWAQSCTQILQTATSDYAEGRLEFVDDNAFTDCFRAAGFAPAEKILARMLVAKVHIYKDRIPEAEEAIIQLLKDDKEHPIDEALDPHEFVYLYRKFRTKPIFRIGGGLAGTYSTMNVIDEFGVEDISGTEGVDTLGFSFTPEIGIGGGVYIDYNFWKNFEVSLGVNFIAKSVSYKNDLYSQFSENHVDDFYSTTSYKDTYFFVDVPLKIKYNFNISPKFIIFPYGGIVGNYLLSASRSGRREVVTPSSVDLKNIRETLNYSYTVGIGFKLRSNTNYFAFEVGAVKGGNNFVDPNGRYQNDDVLFRLGQVDDNQGLNHLNFMLSYQYSIYNPKKLKKYREK